jgi:DNA repair photolyase
MYIIYEPRGRAREYAELAANIYTGCSHGCTYCYAREISKKFGREHDYESPQPRTNIVELVEKDCQKLPSGSGQILLCFTTDPYQHGKDNSTTREIIQTIKKYNLNFCVLTKGGKSALVDIDLYQSGDSFASSLTCLEENTWKTYEPGSASPQERIETIQKFHAAGIETWASLEPVIDPKQTLDIIHQTHDYISLYKIGKLNHVENSTDWQTFGISAASLCDRYGVPFYIKDDLKKYFPNKKFQFEKTRFEIETAHKSVSFSTESQVAFSI